jgi:hypothetical protein
LTAACNGERDGVGVCRGRAGDRAEVAPDGEGGGL